ncbi:uncharacterized protein LOC135710774 [Ochlerotatus camptorhynchus]|uniref:uncharacterized protein LOC135710774 n=1 Tax=Ochlerotatus camptorhynchus TaxID=644619 RepID=UPI0031D86047
MFRRAEQVAPEFLYKPECSWPEEALESTTAEELRMVHVHQLPPTQPVIEFERFSMDESKKDGETLSSEECEQAESTVFKLIQATEYKILRKNHQVQLDQRKRIQKSSRIFKLSPFLDPTGVMRMGSCIAAAECVLDEAKFPVILPKDHYVMQLVINWYHKKYGNANNETVVNEMRQKFHISEL